MKIQNVNVINFGSKKISCNKAYKRNSKANYQYKDTFERNTDKNSKSQPFIYKTANPNEDFCFDKFFNKSTLIASADGKTILSKEADSGSTAIELTEQDKNKTKTTRFKVSKKPNEKSECIYKVSENGKSKIISMDWNFPGKNYNYKGASKDMVKLRKALQHLRNTIHEKEYADDFGYIREVNFQFKAVIGHLQDEINNLENN